MTDHSTMNPIDLVQLGLDSQDPLTRALADALKDHIEELEVTTEAMHDARSEVRVYRYQVIPPLHAEIERLTAILNEKA